jgi:hypothetical protein
VELWNLKWYVLVLEFYEIRLQLGLGINKEILNSLEKDVAMQEFELTTFRGLMLETWDNLCIMGFARYANYIPHFQLPLMPSYS